jgi:hypothetical protein
MYFFDPIIATKYGVNEAIIIQNFKYWIELNRANERSFHDGHWWTYNTNAALAKLFPFWTDRQINHLITKLCNLGILIKGNYNKKGFDRTLWYAFADEELFLSPILQNCKMDFTNLLNPFDKFVRPIPDNNSDSNSDKLNQSGNSEFGNVTVTPSSGQHPLDETPYQQMLDYYHQALPASKRYSAFITDAMRHNLASVWVGLFDRNLDSFKAYIDRVAETPFLTGKVRSKNRKAFFADLDWLIMPNNYKKVIDGFYQQKEYGGNPANHKPVSTASTSASSALVNNWVPTVSSDQPTQPF